MHQPSHTLFSELVGDLCLFFDLCTFNFSGCINSFTSKVNRIKVGCGTFGFEFSSIGLVIQITNQSGQKK